MDSVFCALTERRTQVAEHDLMRLESEDFDLTDAEVVRVEGVESVGRPFEYEAELVTPPVGLDSDAAVGSEVDLVYFDAKHFEQRRVRGMVASLVETLMTDGESRRYRFRIVPRAHRLALVRTTNIHLNLSVPDIIKKKCELVGLADQLVFSLDTKPEARDFVVQFDETDLAFISRLSEHLGIGIVYDDDGGLRLSDNPSGYGELDDPIEFHGRGERKGIYELERSKTAVPASYMVRDYNYRTPLVDLTGSYEVEGAYAGGVVEFGAHFKTPEEGAHMAKIRAEERHVERNVLRGVCADPRMRAGAHVKMTGHPTLGDYEMFVYEVRHVLTQGVAAEEKSKGEARHEMHFSAIPVGVTFRPARVTPRPRIPGVVTGIVDSPSPRPDLAHLDEQGRYRIRFLFDTIDPGDTYASHAVRMIQPHVGANYGIHFPLKPGVEVLLAFVNGDPDRPMIVGAVPNPLTPSPVEVSTNTLNRIKTESGILMEFGDKRIGR
jgi:type VI secretion system secreted protein VgrG